MLFFLSTATRLLVKPAVTVQDNRGGTPLENFYDPKSRLPATVITYMLAREAMRVNRKMFLIWPQIG